MNNDDNVLAAFELSAWDAPPPPAGLADTVIDRMRSTAVPVEQHAAPRRVWIVGGAAVAVIALAFGVWSVVRSTHQAVPASGHVVAERARSLSLDTVHADLDGGADVRWQRNAGVLHVEQRSGRVAWRVDSNDKIVIDAGASMASVEATGANLRVEVEMNAMDTRVSGASALTAAAAAMITVVVYEGHVNVTRPGQPAIVVAPGSTFTVEQPPDLVGATAGARPKVAILGLEHVISGASESDTPAVVQALSTMMRTAARSEGPYQLAPNSDKELIDEKILMNCGSEAPECMAAIGASLDVDALVFGDVEKRFDGYFVELQLLDVRAKTVTRTSGRLIPVDAADADGLDHWGRRIYLSLVRAAPAACDADALTDKAMENVLMDRHAEALVDLEASLACRRDPYVLGLAFMEACYGGNAAKEELYFDQLTPEQQSKLSQSCSHQKADGLTDRVAITKAMARIKPEVLACSANENVGGKLEVAVQVSSDGRVQRATVMDAATEGLRTCVERVAKSATFPATKNGGTFMYPFVLPDSRAVTARATCDADALKDRGTELISTGQHAAALAQLEASLACRRDAYVLELAFMEACSSSNEAKAKQYFKQLMPAQQTKLALICERQNVAYADGVTPMESSLPEGLDRLAITSAMARIRPDVLACGEKVKAGGKVKVKVQVNPDGKVRTIEIVEVSKPELGSCVANVVKTATFPATRKGGSFTYPFMVSGP